MDKKKVFNIIRISGIAMLMIGAILIAWYETETMRLVGGMLILIGVSDVAIGTFLIKREAG